MTKHITPVGALQQTDGAWQFTVWSPQANEVALIIVDGNSESKHSMTRDDFGYWTASVQELKKGVRYFFELNKEKRLPDPASRAQPEGVHKPSAAVPRNFSWSDESWKGLSLGEMVIYELHVGTFSKTGDFQGVISKLGYLRDLGVNAIELMPVSQFPGPRNWGYDGVYPFAVHHDYGGADGLKALVDAAHREGIAVILDVVYNHQGPEGNYLGEFGPYFTDKYKTGWGKAINFDDAWCDGVRSYYWQNALMWLDEFHIDGLRLDAVHAIWDFSARHFILELSEKVKNLQKECGRQKVLIAEFDLNNPRYISPFERGGYALDGQWIDEFHHALHSVITKEVDGYYEDFGAISHLVKSFNDSYVYTGEFSKHRKKFFGVPPDNDFNQFVVFAQNHDQIGNRMLGDRLTEKLSFEQLKLVAATYLLAPQVPMLFMGEEYGETNPFQYFISHTDDELVELVREGRKREFSYFNWQGEVPDPFAEETFQKCKLSWEYSSPERNLLLSYYKHLIEFRKTRLAMQGRSRINVKAYQVAGKEVVCMERNYQNDKILIVFNLGSDRSSFSNPSVKSGKILLDSSSSEWAPNNKNVASEFEGNKIKLNPYSVLICEI